MERRLTAILAADVVGYSRLMTIDEAGTLAALTSLRKNLVNPKISEHNGRIVKLTGDGMLIEFPSVVSAVACAVDIQSAMRTRNATEPAARIEFRIGVNLGDIIVEDGDIFGDGVNVAARLEEYRPNWRNCRLPVGARSRRQTSRSRLRRYGRTTPQEYRNAHPRL